MYQPGTGPSYTPDAIEISNLKWRAMRPENCQTFIRLYEDYKEPLTKRLRNIVGNHETALDLCQETFTRAWQKYFATPGPILQQTINVFEGLLNTIGHNLAIDYLRRSRRYTSRVATRK